MNWIVYPLRESWLLQLTLNTGRELLTCPHTPRAACAVYFRNSHGYVTLTFGKFEVGRFSISIFSSSVTRKLLFVIMAGAQLRAEPSLPIREQISEDGELSENDDFQSFQTPVDKPCAVNSSKMSKSLARRRSKHDILEESLNKKFGYLNDKEDLLLSRSLPAPQRPRPVESSIRTPAPMKKFLVNMMMYYQLVLVVSFQIQKTVLMKITMCLIRTCQKTLRNVYLTFLEKMLWLIKKTYSKNWNCY